MEREVHNITVPYLVRFSWATGEAMRQWDDKLLNSRIFLQNTLPKLIVDNGFAKFAPIIPLEDEEFSHVADAFIASFYNSRWTTDYDIIRNMGDRTFPAQLYGNYECDFDLSNRWDIYRDLWQLALAPECCKKAYFDSPYKDPYHHLYDSAAGKIKKLPSIGMNCLLAPIGFYVSPIVPCSIECKHAHTRSMMIEELIMQADYGIYETLKMLMEMPVRIDSYRGISLVDTPMFKGEFTTDAYKGKYILDVKVKNPELFSYEHDWVAKGARFPFKGIFNLS
jgi:hypothetical protein